LVNFPNCKINIGLKVIRKRDDGFHDIETIFYPLPIYDALEIIKGPVTIPGSKSVSPSGIEFSVSGLPIKDDPGRNLCIRAFELIRKDFPAIPPLRIHLHKAIPIGGGLGGGSTDGVFTLMLLNEKLKLNISRDKLLDYALQLGSDCPFFIVNQPCVGTGRGEVLQPLSIDLSTYSFVLVNPDIPIDTGWAFSNVSVNRSAKPLQQIITQPVESWKTDLKNDFEEIVVNHYRGLNEIKKTLYDHGALYASMTGSGSCFYGIFQKNSPTSVSFENNFDVKYVK